MAAGEQKNCHEMANTLAMDNEASLRITQVDRLHNGIVVTFSDGSSLLYSNDLLEATMPFAVDLKISMNEFAAGKVDDMRKLGSYLKDDWRQ